MNRLLIGLVSVFALALAAGQGHGQDSGVVRDEAVAVAVQPAEGQAIDVVRALYAEPSAPRADLTRYFTNEVANALAADLATRLPAVSADYRYDLPDSPRGTPTFEEADGASGAGVIVTFDGGRVMVELCRQDDGQWRIVDIRDPDEVWTTRAFLVLQATPVTDCDA